jgi:rare lipoprotein A
MLVRTLICLLNTILFLGCGFNEPSNKPENAQFSEKTDIEVYTPIYNYEVVGRASYYANSLHGMPTASGDTYNRTQLTAAHRSLPFGTCVVVTNLRNDSTVEVEINDRGPFHPKRIIDLSRAAAKQLNIIDRGTAPVKLEAYVEEN